jgi:cold shock CspA family protein
MAKTKTSKTTTPVVEEAQAEAPVQVQAVEVQAEPEAQPQVQEVTSGRVKWFNNKAGYGFITVNDCETNEERDMFVHHSEIQVDQTQYKYLVQGEYVEFMVSPINRENKIDVHATSVRGINGGKLMCETRNEVRSQRTYTTTPRQETTANRPQRQTSTQLQRQETTQRQASTQPQRQSTQPQRQSTQPQRQERRPQLAEADQTEWMVVPRRRTDTMPAKRNPRQRQPEIEIA